MPYTVEFAESVAAQFKGLAARDPATILAAISVSFFENPSLPR